MIGRTLSHYKVVEEISRGGMGIVYKALDLKLNREIAVKVLPPELVADPERKRRFVQEAQAAAALNHPNIAHVYGVDEIEGVSFITMELIEGEKLNDRLARGRPSRDTVLNVALGIAKGLAAAHAKNIVHRDLKPANVMLTRAGDVKVIDFGLAKLIETAAGHDSQVATRAKRETQAGQFVGTVSYASPEQARGETVDHRTDIFSLGSVLFEMLCGEPPFRGESAPETLSAIINQPVPELPTGSDVPTAIVERCLEKDRQHRFQTADDLVSELSRFKRDSESGTGIAARSVPRHGRTRLVAALLALAALGTLGTLTVWNRDPSIALVHPYKVTSAIGLEDYPTWSPDGGRIAYESTQAGEYDIWVVHVRGGEPVNLTGDFVVPARYPAWSPDGTEIAFASGEDQGCFVISALGGAPRRVMTATRAVSRPQWSRDARYLACVSSDEIGVEIVDVDTRESRKVTFPDLINPTHDLSWSRDGEWLAFVEAQHDTSEVNTLWVARVGDGELIPLTDGRTLAWSPNWTPDGRNLLYVSDRGGETDIWWQRMARDGSPAGEPRPLTTGIGVRSAAVSADGSAIAYSRGRLIANLWRVSIRTDPPASWGEAEQLTFDQAFIELARVRGDLGSILFSSDRGGNQDVWEMSTGGGEMRQLTTEPTPDWSPNRSPDGSRIAFYSYRSGNRDIWVMSADGGAARQLTFQDGTDMHPSWSPDGNTITYASFRSGKYELWAVSPDGGEPWRMTDWREGINFPLWSPDGQWVYFASRGRIYRIAAAGSVPEPVIEGGYVTWWSADGNRLFFNRDGNIWGRDMATHTEHQMTSLSGRPGSLGEYAFGADAEYLYFAWQEDVGDIWVMDVVTEKR